MHNETHQVQMPIILGPARDLENPRFEHRVGLVAHTLRRQIQGVGDRLNLML
jgi:hypothetical protein